MQEKSSGPKYPSDHWGGLAEDPTIRIGASGEIWISVIRDTWLRNGGTEDEFYEVFPEYAPPLPALNAS
jgi:hypothetical protein